jgi:hypothetical protein
MARNLFKLGSKRTNQPETFHLQGRESPLNDGDRADGDLRWTIVTDEIDHKCLSSFEYRRPFYLLRFLLGAHPFILKITDDRVVYLSPKILGFYPQLHCRLTLNCFRIPT